MHFTGRYLDSTYFSILLLHLLTTRPKPTLSLRSHGGVLSPKCPVTKPPSSSNSCAHPFPIPTTFIDPKQQSDTTEVMEMLCFPTARFSPHRPIRPQPRSGRATVRCAQVATTAPMGEKTQYKDGFFEKAFMGLFSRKMQKYASGGIKTKRQLWEWDYDSFVDVSRRVMMGRSRQQQQEVVRDVLLSMLPPGAPAQFRKLFPPTKWAAEFNAALTVPFFHWLVGPSEVIEVEVDGMKQRSGVHIKKCRYLENSGCVGMCVNMCKIPTQDFFTNEFGLPLTMNPNFEDMSCDMLYGQAPPPFEEDPVSKQPCFANICSLANPSTPVCHKLYN